MGSFGFLLDEGERIEEVLSVLQDGAPHTWRPHRIIFRNFWFFQKEEFIWHHGRLFLGGQNAAGKSTVLSMAVPLLLDGNKSEERLNTFGGHGRHMAYYVTGSPTPDDSGEAAYYYRVRTAYIALEFYDRSPSGEERYLTFGQGLHHDRDSDDKSVKSWGFVISDGRRIGRRHDGELFDLIKENGLSLSKPELRKLLGQGGELFDTNAEYKREVNRRLFGFKDVRDFDALIDLLLQIRRPKLTKEVRPRDVAEILTRSLPALDDAVMQVTADALDHIDRTTENLERIDEQIKAAEALDKAAGLVFRRMAEGAAAQYRSAHGIAARAAAELESHRADLAEANALLANATRELAECRSRVATLQTEKRSLEQDDAFQATAALAEVRAKMAAAKDEFQALHGAIRMQLEKVRQAEARMREREQEWLAARNEGLEAIAQAIPGAESARWESAGQWLAGLRGLWETLQSNRVRPDLASEVPRAAVLAEGAERRRQLAEARALQALRDEARSAWERAQGAENSARERYIAEEARATMVARQVEDGRDLAADAILRQAALSPSLRLEEALTDGVALALRRYVHHASRRPHDLLAPIRQAKEAAQAAAAGAVAAARTDLAQLDEQIAELQRQKRLLDQAPPEPARSAAAQLARKALREAQIPFASFYETIDLQPAATPEQLAAIEQSLLEMGLLDGLVIPPARRAEAMALLQQQGLSERLLLVPEGLPPCRESVAPLLRPDPEHPLAAAAAPLLARVGHDARGTAVSVSADGGPWQHGLLEGVPEPCAQLRYIGRSARERYRIAELARLGAELAACASDRTAAADRLSAAEAHSVAIVAEWEALESLQALSDLDSACRELDARRQVVQRESEVLQAAGRTTTQARLAWDQQETAWLELCRHFPAVSGLSREGLERLILETNQVQAAFDQVHSHALRLQGQWQLLEQASELAAMQRRELDRLEEDREARDLQIGELEGRERGLQRRLEHPDARTLFERVAVIGQELLRLETRKDELIGVEATAKERARSLTERLPSLEEEAARTSAREGNAHARFQESLSAYPSLAEFAGRLGAGEGALQVAAALLSRFEDRPSLAEDIAQLEAKSRADLSEIFAARRSLLRPFHPEHLPAERSARLVQFVIDGPRASAHDLLQYLQSQAEALRGVLQRHEADLFERHLLQDVGQEVQRCMTRARDWVTEINDLLATYPLRNNEQVYLEWEPKRAEHELGGTIARHADKLWKSEATLTQVERDLLKGAFREEINQVREQARRGEWRSDLFREKLAEVLDYRNWFRFRLFVRGGVAGKTEITDTVHNARSGSERALVLLLPLIAGLSVRYDGAAPDAPRILALDEAFAGIDAVNSAQLIRFLTALRLTWVASSEKPPNVTEELRGASIYSMLREGTVVATRPFFWDGRRLVDAETEWWGDGHERGA